MEKLSSNVGHICKDLTMLVNGTPRFSGAIEQLDLIRKNTAQIDSGIWYQRGQLSNILEEMKKQTELLETLVKYMVYQHDRKEVVEFAEDVEKNGIKTT